MRNSQPTPTQPVVPVRNIRSVVLGDIAFKTWYPSFYPEALVGKELETLYICKTCFVYSDDLSSYLGHVRACPLADSPPGRLIYTKSGFSIWELDGEDDKLFSQNLSLFAKLFLDNKSVFFDVQGFHYYLLTASLPPLGSTSDAKSRPDGPATSTLPSSPPLANGSEHQAASGYGPSEQIVGFFSKEKLSWDANNLACILVFPPWQRRGLGKVLMGASYALSRREERVGGPEKPLSELGRRGYLAFWQARVAVAVLAARNKSVFDVAELSDRCAMATEDVIYALREMMLCEKKRTGDVLINKAKVREWMERNRINLRPPVDDEAFIIEEEEYEEESEGEEEE